MVDHDEGLLVQMAASPREGSYSTYQFPLKICEVRSAPQLFIQKYTKKANRRGTGNRLIVDLDNVIRE